MRREDYERAYGRRGLHPPPSSSHSSRRIKSSKRKMKCLIGIGLLLPALAAVIGVAAWAVSADVVMNSNNANRVNKPDNHQHLQGMTNNRHDNQRDIFNNAMQKPHMSNDERNYNRHYPDETSSRSTTTTTRSTTTSTSTTTTTTPAPVVSSSTSTAATPSTADVSAILSRLLSASAAASGNNGPRFVVVAPLPDHAKVLDDLDSQTISRSDQPPTASSKVENRNRPVEKKFHHTNQHDTENSAPESAAPHQHNPTHHSVANVTSRVGLANTKPINQRRTGDQHFVLDLSNSQPRRSYNGPTVEISGFESFLSPETMMGSASAQAPAPPPPVPGFAGPFSSRGPHQNHYNPPPPPPPPREPQHKPMFDPNHVYDPNPLPPTFNHGFGLKPIQQLVNHDVPLRPDESNQWSALSFHSPPGGVYLPQHQKPNGISLSISPGHTLSHSSEPSVIKSFFLPFVPKPKLNMNARVVFGVVLDKGFGFGGAKKDAGHLHPPY